MISLTYMSTATAPYDIAQLSGLLDATREKNRAVGLTGMLLYAGGHFIQTLEGPEEVVDATFARIVGDSRHRDVHVVLREPIEARVFADWSMGFESIPVEESAALPGFNDYLAGEVLSEEDRQAYGRAGIFHRVFRDNMR